MAHRRAGGRETWPRPHRERRPRYGPFGSCTTEGSVTAYQGTCVVIAGQPLPDRL